MTREEIEARVANARTGSDLDQLTKDCAEADRAQLQYMAAEYLAARILEMPALREMVAKEKTG